MKEKEKIKNEDYRVFFQFNEDFQNLINSRIKEKIDKKIPILLNKDNFDYFHYLHKVYLYFY